MQRYNFFCESWPNVFRNRGTNRNDQILALLLVDAIIVLIYGALLFVARPYTSPTKTKYPLSLLRDLRNHVPVSVVVWELSIQRISSPVELTVCSRTRVCSRHHFRTSISKVFSNRWHGNNHYWAYQTNNDRVEYDGILMSLTLLNKKKSDRFK
jgi:hypothetical protein